MANVPKLQLGDVYAPTRLTLIRYLRYVRLASLLRRMGANDLEGRAFCRRGVAVYPRSGLLSSMGYRYHYYSCRKKRSTQYDARHAKNRYPCPKVKAEWLEELVWADVRSFLENPGEVLERVREQLSADQEGEDLQERHAALMDRLAAKQEEKARYLSLYAKGHVDEEELEVFMADFKNQTENLKLLITSVESDLAQKDENKLVAASTEAWLVSLRSNLAAVEEDTEEAFKSRRGLVKLLVEQIVMARDEEGRPKVEITYRFGPPAGNDSADGSQNLDEFKKAHARGGTGELMRGHPQMSTYEVAVEREPAGGPA